MVYAVCDKERRKFAIEKYCRRIRGCEVMKMKKNWSLIASAAALALAVVCVVKVISIADSLGDMRQSISSQLNDMKNGIDGIETRVLDAIDAQGSLISYSGWVYEDTDISGGSVSISCTITPKEYTESTEAYIVCNGKEYVMTGADRSYTAVISIPVFENSNISSVVFSDGDTVRTQSLDMSIFPRYDILPIVSGRFDGSGEGKKNAGSFSYTRNGLVFVDVENSNYSGVEKAEIVFETDGKETGREQIDLSYSAQEEYIDKASTGNSRITMPEENQYDESSYSRIYYYLENTAEIEFGGVNDIYVEITYDTGLCMRSLCDSISVDENGSVGAGNYQFVGAEGSIIDENGKELYSVKLD